MRTHGRDAKAISRDMGNRTIGAIKKYYQKNRKCARLIRWQLRSGLSLKHACVPVRTALALAAASAGRWDAACDLPATAQHTQPHYTASD